MNAQRLYITTSYGRFSQFSRVVRNKQGVTCEIMKRMHSKVTGAHFTGSKVSLCERTDSSVKAQILRK